MDKQSQDIFSVGSPQDKLMGRGARLRQACIDSAGGGEPLLFLDGHDDAIIGVTERDGEMCMVYDEIKVIQTLHARDGMQYAGAIKFFEERIAGSWRGSQNPIFVRLARG